MEGRLGRAGQDRAPRQGKECRLFTAERLGRARHGA
jgi:hypothetical protein